MITFDFPTSSGKIVRVKLTSGASSGTLNFFGPGKGPGHGWWYHQYLKWIFRSRLDYSGLSTWIAKTTTLNENAGNLKINKKTLQPIERFPDCVIIKPIEGVILNSAGLSSPGLLELMSMHEWQKNTQPFGISLALASSDPIKRMKELEKLVEILGIIISQFRAPFFIEYNPSCPNQGFNLRDLERYILEELKMLSSLEIPLSVKLSPMTSLEIIRSIEKSGLCQWISFSNSIPFGEFSDKIDWGKFFGTVNPRFSPLFKRGYGAGGLSGWPLVDINCTSILAFREAGITIPFFAGGGIGCRNLAWLRKEIKAYKKVGADAVQFGSIVPLRPWLVEPAIRIANETFA